MKNKLLKIKVLKELNKEFNILAEGYCFEKSYKPVIKIDTQIQWEEGDEASIRFLKEDFQDDIDKMTFDFYKSAERECKKYNIKIKKFINKCDKYAKQFGCEEYKFFDEMMSYKDK